MKEYDVFISHSTADAQITKDIVEYLEGLGVRCWISSRDIPHGASWPNEITKGIERCRLFLLVLSSNSNSSKHVEREIVLAEEAHLEFMPFVIENIVPSHSIKYFFGNKQWINAFEHGMEISLNKLYHSIHNVLKTKTDSTNSQVHVPSPKETKPVEKLAKGSHLQHQYRIAGLEELLEIGIDSQIVEDETRRLDFDDYEGLTEESAGTPEQWIEIWDNHPEFWRVLLFNNKIVGYFLFTFLDEENFEKLKAGQLGDSDITDDIIINVDNFECQFGDNYCYFMDVVIEKEHRIRGSKMLFDAFVNQLIYFAENGIFITELCAIGYTRQGDALCKKIGMDFISSHPSLNDIYNIYSLRLIPFPKDSFFAKNYPKLQELYDDSGS